MYSRTACTKNALTILELQSVIDRETQVGGRLYDDQWRNLEIIKTAFLLGTTVLCVDLNQSQSCSDEQLPEETERNQMVFSALNTSYGIWMRSSSSSQEAQKVIEALRIVLRKFETSRAKEPAAPRQQDVVSEQTDIAAPSPLANTPLSTSNFQGSVQNMTSNWPLEFPDITMDDFDFVSYTLFDLDCADIVRLTRRSRVGILRIRLGTLIAC
jgi:hypothetical protein